MDNSERELLEEMVKWLKFMGIQEARGVVESALKYEDEEKTHDAKIVYQLTDGTRSTKDIEEYISFSYRWVSSRHNEWAKLGIVEKEGPQDPYRHLMPLDELGIECPEIPEPKEEAATEEESDSDDESAQTTLEAE